MTDYQCRVLDFLYGKEVTKKVVESKSFVVGAGGIGCELAKTLSTTGF
jgi:molybdopterin/thiamine biosynthesis adenylyltransferase